MQELKLMKALTAACAIAPAMLSGWSAPVQAQVPTQNAEAGTWTAHHENVLGTSLAMAVHAPSQAIAGRAEKAVLAEFDRQSKILSAWDKTSEFSRWQRTRNVPVPISVELYETLARFDVWQQRTHGLLNAGTESASVLWRNAALVGSAPQPAALAASVDAMRQRHWTLDSQARTATHLSETPLVLATFVKSRITSAAANAALREGADGIMLNVGGDIVTRGRTTQRVDIADPRADAENDIALDTVVLSDSAIATSGGYRRQMQVGNRKASHLIDPRTGRPAEGTASATVIAPDAETAGALATALAIASPNEAETLAHSFPGTEYLLVAKDGSLVRSKGWARNQEPALLPVAYRVTAGAKPPAVASTSWNQNFELLVKVNLPRIDDPRYRRPYVAVWIEDENKYPVRTIALWFQKPRWLPDLKTWYRDDRIRNLSEGTDLTGTISSATRGPGSYTLKWDGKDNEGKLVKPGKYTICVEGAREHGGYGVVREEMDFSGKPQSVTLPEQPEIGAIGLDYRKR